MPNLSTSGALGGRVFIAVEDLTLNLHGLSRLLKRSPATIKTQLIRHPAAVPPSIAIDGCRLLLWDTEQVLIWLRSQSRQRVSSPPAVGVVRVKTPTPEAGTVKRPRGRPCKIQL